MTSSIRARPFDFPYDGNLQPGRCALLIIDMQEDFLGSAGYFAAKGYDPAPLRAIVPTIRRLADGLRAAGVRIIWTRQGYRSDLADFSPYDRWRAERAGLAIEAGGQSPFTRGSPGFQIVPELTPAPADILLDKTANSSFCQTELDSILRAQGITHLLFAGCTTDVCVHSTLRDATDRKYQCLLIEDACASGDAYAHAAAIHMVTVEDGIFGTVADSEAVLAAFLPIAAAKAGRATG